MTASAQSKTGTFTNPVYGCKKVEQAARWEDAKSQDGMAAHTAWYSILFVQDKSCFEVSPETDFRVLSEKEFWDKGFGPFMRVKARVNGKNRNLYVLERHVNRNR